MVWFCLVRIWVGFWVDLVKRGFVGKFLEVESVVGVVSGGGVLVVFGVGIWFWGLFYTFGWWICFREWFDVIFFVLLLLFVLWLER